MTTKLSQIKFDLEVIPCSKAAPAGAGWLAGDDASVWLMELGHCAAQGKPVGMFAVAKAVDDHTCVGAFLVPLSPTQIPVFSKRVLPLYELEKAIYLPVGSRLSMGLLDHERAFLFPHRWNFVHPTLGVVGFSEDDVVDPVTLLVLPPGRATNWEFAISAPESAPPMGGISVAQPESPDEMIAQGGSDIGSKQGGLGKKGEGIGSKLGAVGSGLAGGAVLGLSGLFGGGKKRSDELSQDQSDQFLDWAKKNWEGLFDARKREIDRLLQKLKDDPDEGLRYALPLGGGGGGRGVAPPSTRLGARSMGFNLGGGGPSDSWDLSFDQRMALEQQYRDAAAREMKKGNFDRAAYIYGNLLGDWNGAAKALEEAGKFREAVSIYIHKMNNRQAAALCYERGLMYTQAADLFEEVRDWEKAGDLHDKSGNEERARQLWIKAADKAGNVLQKASIWSGKLRHDAMALELLDAEWPRGNRSAEIVTEMFRLLQKYHQVDRAVDLGDRILNHPRDIRGLELDKKLAVLHQVSQRWSAPQMSDWLHGEMWQRIAVEVTAESKLTTKLLKLVPQMAPEDKLLKRDAERFALPKRQLRAAKPSQPKGSLRPAEICEAQVPGDWHSLRSMRDGVSFTGRGSGVIVFGRWDKGNGSRATEFRIPVDPNDGGPVEHTVVGTGTMHQRVLHFRKSRRAYFQTSGVAREVQYEDFSNLREVLAIGPHVSTGDFLILVYTDTNSLMVSYYHKNCGLLKSISIDVAPPNVKSFAWQIAAGDKLIGIAADNFFACRDEAGMFTTLALHGVPWSIDVCPTYGESFVLVVGSEVILVEYRDRGKLETVNLYISEMGSCSPVASFLSNSLIAIAWSGGGAVYSPDNYIKPIASFSFPKNAGDPVGIRSCGLNSFMLLTKMGNLIRFDFD